MMPEAEAPNDAGASRTPGRVAFVIMPFAEAFRPGFRDVISPAVRRAELDCVRADQEFQGHIHGQMFERILDSDVVIADISALNPNVFYELGVAHSTSRKTVTVAREDFIEQVPFDIAPYRVLVYPAPPLDPSDDEQRKAYVKRASSAEQALHDALIRLIEEGSDGIPNPVQDYLSSRSPVESAESMFLPEFSHGDEEKMLESTREELVYVSLTGSSLRIAGHVESGKRTTPLHLKVLVLDPDDREAWRFVYGIREARSVSDEELEELLEDDRSAISRVRRRLNRLKSPTFTAEVRYYSSPPLFWAYLVDRSRLILGHLALGRLSASHLPVSVIVRDDPKTASLWTGYTSMIDKLWGPD